MVTVPRFAFACARVAGKLSKLGSFESFRSPVAFWLCSADNTPWLALSKPLSPPLFVVSLLVLRSAVASSQRTTPFYSLVSVRTRVHSPPDHIPSDLAPFWGGHIQRVLVWIQAQSTQVLHLCPLPPPSPPPPTTTYCDSKPIVCHRIVVACVSDFVADFAQARKPHTNISRRWAQPSIPL